MKKRLTSKIEVRFVKEFKAHPGDIEHVSHVATTSGRKNEDDEHKVDIRWT